ncbi:MAG: rRNA maturation RNase YbeY [Chloroflexota bacterium]
MTRANVVDGWRIDVTIREMISRTLSRTEIARVVAGALSAAGAPPGASLSVILTDDEELADLNETHLGHEGPTDVLSFPLLPREAFPSHAGFAPTLANGDGTFAGSGPAFVLPPGARLHLGDIAVSVERARAQAAAGQGGQTGDIAWSTEHELRLLLTHGTLHICGWDHAEPVEEAAMRALERELLRLVPGR